MAAGGTLGALAGPWAAAALLDPDGIALSLPKMLLIGGGCIVASAASAAVMQLWVRRRGATAGDDRTNDAPLGGSIFEGITHVARSPLLLGIAAYILLIAVMGTLLYFTQLRLVADAAVATADRARLFARFDGITQAATLVLQVLVAGPLMRRLGTAAALISLPLVSIVGFIALGLDPTLMMLVIVQSGYKAVQRAVARPACEAMFASVPRTDRFKAKSFLDTVVYRFGDVVGSQVEAVIGRMGDGLIALAGTAVGIGVVWTGIGWFMGRRADGMATDDEDGEDGGAARKAGDGTGDGRDGGGRDRDGNA
ncbi:MAG: hypothetical protein AB8G96_12405 [Phycisphaerales bacterium]